MIIKDIWNHKFNITIEDISRTSDFNDYLNIYFNKPMLDEQNFSETFITVRHNKEVKELLFTYEFIQKLK